jgi:hypothetical protein
MKVPMMKKHAAESPCLKTYPSVLPDA